MKWTMYVKHKLQCQFFVVFFWSMLSRLNHFLLEHDIEQQHDIEQRHELAGFIERALN